MTGSNTERSATPTKTRVFARSARPRRGATLTVNVAAAAALSRSRRLTAVSPQDCKQRGQFFPEQRGAKCGEHVLSTATCLPHGLGRNYVRCGATTLVRAGSAG